MEKTKLRRLAAVLLTVMIAGTFVTGVIFAFLGNGPVAFGLIGFNIFFSVIVYFLMRANRYIKD